MATRWLQQATFFRREAFRLSPGFNTENRTSWDGELFVSMVHMGATVGYIDADLAAFRIHNESISGTGRLWMLTGRIAGVFFARFAGGTGVQPTNLLRFLYRVEGLLLRAGSW